VNRATAAFTDHGDPLLDLRRDAVAQIVIGSLGRPFEVPNLLGIFEHPLGLRDRLVPMFDRPHREVREVLDGSGKFVILGDGS
jgi:hypothetical protein